MVLTQGKNIRKPETELCWVCWLYRGPCPPCCVALMKLWNCTHGRSEHVWCVTEGEGGYQSHLLPSNKWKPWGLHRAPLKKPSKGNLFPWSTDDASVMLAWIWGEMCVLREFDLWDDPGAERLVPVKTGKGRVPKLYICLKQMKLGCHRIIPEGAFKMIWF